MMEESKSLKEIYSNISLLSSVEDNTNDNKLINFLINNDEYNSVDSFVEDVEIIENLTERSLNFDDNFSPKNNDNDNNKSFNAIDYNFDSFYSIGSSLDIHIHSTNSVNVDNNQEAVVMINNMNKVGNSSLQDINNYDKPNENESKEKSKIVYDLVDYSTLNKSPNKSVILPNVTSNRPQTSPSRIMSIPEPKYLTLSNSIERDKLFKVLEDKAIATMKLIEEADSIWRNKLEISLNDSLKVLRKQHVNEISELQNMKSSALVTLHNKSTYKFSTFSLKREKSNFLFTPERNIYKTVDLNYKEKSGKEFLLTNKYDVMQSHLSDNYNTDVSYLILGLKDAYRRLTRIKNDNINKVKLAYDRAATSVSHSSRLQKASIKFPHENILNTRAKKSYQVAYIVICKSLQVIAEICSELHHIYDGIESSRGPIQLKSPTKKLQLQTLYPAGILGNIANLEYNKV